MSDSPRKLRTVAYADEAACIADVRKLAAGYHQSGAWTLPQMCYHCSITVPPILHEPANPTPTDEQKKSQTFIDDVNAEGWPEQQFPTAPAMVPPADCGEQAIEDFVKAYEQLNAYTGKQVDHPFFGPVETPRFRKFLLIHAAHHFGYLAHKPKKLREVKYASEAEVIADLKTLQDGFRSNAQWTLPQAAWHLNSGFALALQPPKTTERTPQQQQGQKFLEEVAVKGWPDQFYETVPQMVPAVNVGSSAVEAYVAALQKLAAYPHTHVDHHVHFGPVEVKTFRAAMLAHAAHHLSFFEPVAPPPRRGLKFADVRSAIADIEFLRSHGYEQAGAWNLPQIAWHLAPIMTAIGGPPETPNPKIEAMQAGFFAGVGQVAAGRKLDAPARFVPPADAGDEAVDRFIAAFKQLDTNARPLPNIIVAHLQHAARHLAFLKPKNGLRKGLKYADTAACIADIHALRAGYVQCGAWNLQQICWHIDVTIQLRTAPGQQAPNTPEQTARADVLKNIFATNEIPPGLVAPPTMQPPMDADDDAIATLLKSLETMRTHVGFAPHRLFGHMSDDEHRRHLLITRPIIYGTSSRSRRKVSHRWGTDEHRSMQIPKSSLHRCASVPHRWLKSLTDSQPRTANHVFKDPDRQSR